MSARDVSVVSCRPLFISMPPPAYTLLPVLAEFPAAATAATAAAMPADEATADGVTALVKMMPMFSVYSLSVHAVIMLAEFGASSAAVWLLTALGAADPAPPTIVTFVGDRANNTTDHNNCHYIYIRFSEKKSALQNTTNI